MIYLSIGQGIRNGLSLYSQIYDNKPPLLYLIAAISGNLFWFKAILTFWMLATTVAFWKISKSKISTLIFAVITTIPFLEGNTVNAELFMIGPVILAFYYLLTKKLNPKMLIISGLLFGIASLFKVPAAFDLPVIIVFWLIKLGLKSWKKILKNTFYLSLGFITPITATFIWYFAKSDLTHYLNAAYLQNIGYINSWGVQVPLSVRVVLLAGLITTMAIVRKRISKEFLFACLWLVFSLFAATLSQRPYPHYLIQSAAPIAILLGFFLTNKTIEQSLSVIALMLAFFVPTFYKFYSYPTIPYYSRFISLITGKIDKATYLKSFSPNTERNYEIAKFLNMSSLPSDSVFVWDNDSPTIYALSRRLPPVKFVADYHINDYSNKSEVAKLLGKNNPKFIILTWNHPFPEIQSLVRTKYILIQQINGAEIWSGIDK